MNVANVSNFHPMYEDVVKLGFEQYFRQIFIREDARVELYLNTYYRNYSPENGGKFKSLDTFEKDGNEHKVDLETLTLHLAFIGVNEEYRRKMIGTQLLSDIVQIADKYDMRMDLDIDESFGMTKKDLRKWYQRFGFIHIRDSYMIRLSFSERVAHLIPVKDKWNDLLEFVSNLYQVSSQDEGYSQESKIEFEEVAKKLKSFSRVEYWGYDHLYWITEAVKDYSGLVAAFDINEEHKDLNKFLEWSKEALKKSKNKE